MNNIRHDKFYKEYAWVIFLLIGIMIMAGGLPHILGVNTDPALVEAISGKSIDSLNTSYPEHFNLYNFYFRSGGLSDIGVAFFLIMITVFSYKNYEKWSWYTLSFVPVFFIVFIVLSLDLPIEGRKTMIPPLLILTLLSLLGLLLPFRKFFPKKK